MEPMNLRDRLRTGTRRAQDALEASFARFDLGTSDGLRAFLAVQSDMVATLAGAGDETLAAPLAKAAGRLAADLETLGHDADPAPHPAPGMDEPVARLWLWHATRLPLRMQWRRVGPGLPSGALSAPRDSAAWRDFCETLEARDGFGAAAEREVTSANEWYALYETACYARARVA